MEHSTVFQSTAIESAERMREAGQTANHHVSAGVFADYHSRKAANTRKSQGFDLAVFAEYLAVAGVAVDAASRLQHDLDAWQGVTWGAVAGFVKWQLPQGHAVASLNRRLSTVKAYVKLAAQAGAITAQDLALIKTVAGYGQKEAKRVNEARSVARVGHKKAEYTSITDEQAKALKTQPDSPQGKHGLPFSDFMMLFVTLPRVVE